MNKIIAIANHKSGVGKTTTAVNFAVSLALMEKKTLLIDCDPHAQATRYIGLDPKAMKYCLYHFYKKEAIFSEVVKNTEIDLLDIIPASFQLLKIDNHPHEFKLNEHSLRLRLNDVRNKYDYIIIDCPSSLRFLTISALSVSDDMIIPYYLPLCSFTGLAYFLGTVRYLKQHLSIPLRITGILLTMCNHINEVDQYYPKHTTFPLQRFLLKTTIPPDVFIHDSFVKRKPVGLYDIGSKGSEKFLNLALEIDTLFET
ncbi:MAG: AAA family ATPase [Desulfobacterales bacterium]|nr:AAA family ATPase [Desulfobacterales bacterium]